MTDIAVWISQFHFLRPLWLLALIPAMLLVLALAFRRARAGEWRHHIAPHLLNYLLEDGGKGSRRGLLWGLLVGWLLAIIALAGPAWEKLPQPVQRGGSPLVVLWDMSPSMMAQDLEPSRLVRSRLKLVDLLRQRREGVTGLVAYAGEAHVVTPLTDDTRTVINMLPALSPANMPMAGSNPEMALRMGLQLLNDAGVARGDVLLVTDEIVPQAFDQLKRIIGGTQHQLTLWGVGTAEGAPIPLPDGGFARNASGGMVVAKLNESALQDFAADAGAYYVPMLLTDEDVETLQRLFGTQPADLREADRNFDTWYEHGPWLLLALLPLAALAFRRGWLIVMVVVAPLGLPQPAQALSWQDLWLRQDQQGLEALTEGEAEEAARLFENPDWRGTALYRAGEYDAALEAFKQGTESPRNLYNQGNALMHLGDYEAALDAYDAVLERDPDNQDALANRQLAERLLQEQQQAQQQNQQQGEGEDQQGQESGQDSGAGQEDQQAESGEGNEPQDQGQGQHEGSPRDDPGNNAAGEMPGEEDSGEGEEPAADETPGSEQDQESQDTAQEAGPTDGRQELADETPQEAQAAAGMTEAEREQQQALEQWLRKIPDDPGGLMRNKFQYEFRERRRTGAWQGPNNDAGQRW